VDQVLQLSESVDSLSDLRQASVIDWTHIGEVNS